MEWWWWRCEEEVGDAQAATTQPPCAASPPSESAGAMASSMRTDLDPRAGTSADWAPRLALLAELPQPLGVGRQGRGGLVSGKSPSAG